MQAKTNKNAQKCETKLEESATHSSLAEIKQEKEQLQQCARNTPSRRMILFGLLSSIGRAERSTKRRSNSKADSQTIHLPVHVYAWRWFTSHCFVIESVWVLSKVRSNRVKKLFVANDIKMYIPFVRNTHSLNHEWCSINQKIKSIKKTKGVL